MGRNEQHPQADYADRVVAVLAWEFPGLRDQETASVVTGLVERMVAGAVVEVIVDEVHRANWRLCPAPGHPGRVVLSCAHLNPRPTDRALQDDVNETLRDL